MQFPPVSESLVCEAQAVFILVQVNGHLAPNPIVHKAQPPMCLSQYMESRTSEQCERSH